MPIDSILRAASQEIISFSLTTSWPDTGSVMVLRLTRPRIVSDSGRSICSPL